MNTIRRVLSLFKKDLLKDKIRKIGESVNEFINSHKNSLIVFTFAVGVLSSAIVHNEFFNTKRDSYRNTIIALNDSIKTIKISKDRVISEKAAIQLSLDDFKLLDKSKDEEIIKLSKTVRELRARKPETVFVTNINTETSSTITDVKIIPCDTDTTVNFNDKVLDANIKIVGHGSHVSIDSLSYSVSIPLSVSLGLDGSVSVITDDNVRISSLNSWIDPRITSKPKKKWFSVGAQIGYGLTPSGFGPYAGLGASINLINF